MENRERLMLKDKLRREKQKIITEKLPKAYKKEKIPIELTLKVEFD